VSVPQRMTRRLSVHETQQAAMLLRAGGLVALPTETVYGLAADVRLPAAIDAVFDAKERPASDPLIVHLSHHLLGEDIARGLVSTGWARDGQWRGAVEALSAAAWPGPLTVVLPRGPRATDRITATGPSVAVRIPAHGATLSVLDALGDAVVAPSANRFGRISPTSADAVLTELDGRIDAVLDGGPCTIGVESTVITLVDTPAVLRPGAFDATLLAAWIGAPVATHAAPASATPHASPGLLDRHYAPRTRVIRLAARETWEPGASPPLGRFAWLCWSSPDERVWPWSSACTTLCLCPDGDVAGAARRLYATMRDLDEACFDALFVEVPPDGPGLLTALNDRLRRASSSTPILRPTLDGLLPV